MKVGQATMLLSVMEAGYERAVAYVAEFIKVESSARSSKFRLSDTHALVFVGDIVCACVFARSDEVWTIVHPTHVDVTMP